MAINKNIKTVVLLIFMMFQISCKKNPVNMRGNWAWISTENKYFEVLIDSTDILGYRSGFWPLRKYKTINDSLYLDKTEKGYALDYKIEIIDKNRILLTNHNYSIKVEMIKLNNNDFTIDSIQNDKDKKRFELEFNTREEIWKSSKKSLESN